MRATWMGLSLALVLPLQQAWAEEFADRTRLPEVPGVATVGPPRVLLGRPEPIDPTATSETLEAAKVDFGPVESAPAAAPRLMRVGLDTPRPLVRSQSPEAPPPPPVSPFGTAAGPVVGPTPAVTAPGKDEGYRCGIVNDNADTGGFWTRTGGRVRRCYEDITGSVTGIFTGTTGRQPFQSDHAFDVFSSPVSNPFYFEDPRALTELRPIFIWQQTRSSNPVFAGGDNFFGGLQARLAVTENISLVVNKLGWVWTDPRVPFAPDFYGAHAGLSELHLGPKFTLCRNDVSNTVAAAGLTFEVPVGPRKVYQNTGNLSLTPYFSIAQNFGRSNYGSFNLLNTTGYAAAIDGERTDFVFSSFHVDYNILNLNRFFPMVELNWTHYTLNGNARSLNFEGRDMFNFGSNAVAGHDELTLAAGGRVKLNDNWQFGVAGEVSLLGGASHMDAFRLTVDLIFRY